METGLLRKGTAALLAAAMLWGAGQAWAADDAAFQLDQVTVTADRIPQTVASTPANVTVITGAELQDNGARTLADALTGVSGVLVRSYGGPGEKAIPYVLGTDRVVVLVDGKRVNLPQGIGTGSGGVDLNTILLADNIDRIEVVRGGASALYGADAVGGVVNIITKKGAGAAKTTATVAGGNYGGRYYALNAGGQANKTHWQFSGVRDSTDGQRANSAYRGQNASFRLDRDLTKNESLTFTYDYYGSRAGMPGSLAWPTPADFGSIVRHNWSAGYANEHAVGSRSFRYYSNDQVYYGENYGSFRHENTVRVFEYQDSARLNAANLLTWGGEWRRDEVTSTGAGLLPRTGITKAVYLQDQLSFNSAAKLTVGIRRDDNSIYGVHWLPKAAFLYQATANTGWFVNWGKVFKAPSFDDLYADDGWGNTGNPNLKPESGWTGEVGVKTKLSAATEATLSYFRRDLTDAIRWTMDAAFTWHPQNIDHLKTSGLTASLATKLSAATTADFGYTYLDSRDQNGDDIGDPRHSFQLGLNVHSGKWAQRIYGVYQDRTGTGASRVYSRFVVNTNTVFALSRETSLFLTVNNLFNRQYQAHKDYPANGRTMLFGVKQTI
jgi:outer membrane cobalamin receptor